MLKSTVDRNAPFVPLSHWEKTLYADDYIGKVIDGPFANFNLFDNGRKYFVLVFGRTVSIDKINFKED